MNHPVQSKGKESLQMRQELQLERGTYCSTIQKATAITMAYNSAFLLILKSSPIRKGKTRKSSRSTSSYIKALFSVNHPPEQSFQKNKEKGGEHKEASCFTDLAPSLVSLVDTVGVMLRNDAGLFQALSGKKKKKEAQVTVFIPG